LLDWLDHVLIAAALPLNTASTPPIACSASDAAPTISLAKAPIAAAPITLETMSMFKVAVRLDTTATLPNRLFTAVQFIKRGQYQFIVGVKPIGRRRARNSDSQLHR
jgi:hypothetical protein